MKNIKVMITGASGMLGAMVLDVLSRESEFQLIATIRHEKYMRQNIYPNVEWRILDAEQTDQVKLIDTVDNINWIINCIGVIKPYIHDNNPDEIERALMVNAVFPYRLARAAANKGIKILQIATDCVYAGDKGLYTESSSHDPLDVYGKTKSLGEVLLENVHHLRCSIIGPEPKAHVSLLDWFLSQKQGGNINGFTNHQWNGITTLHFARVCQGIIKESLKLKSVQHIIPGSMISKADMLKCFSNEYRREDIAINPVKAPTIIDRTLSTNDDQMNRMLWQSAGYSTPPSIPQMIHEMANYKCRWIS